MNDSIKTYRWKTIRVFISSTFRDFHAERDYLVKYVFPDLRQWCERYKLHLVDIDLRWGVTADEAQSGRVIDICLEQIDGARPFFLCMLGNRYGWVPGADEVPDATFKTYDRLALKNGCSVTHMEILHAVLDPLTSFKELEEVPHSFFYFREGLEGVDPISGFKETFFEQGSETGWKLDLLKGEIETHFEKVGKKNGNPYEVEERIFNYFPEFDPDLVNPEDDALKGRLTKESLKEFGPRVKSDLQKAIATQHQERIETLSEQREEDRLASELDFHEVFVENRTRLFVGRTVLIREILDYIDTEGDKILAVYGEPGSGKSAIMAQCYNNLKASLGPDSDVLVIPHFVGASPGSSALYNLLGRMCEELKIRFDIEAEIPSDTNKLPDAFMEFLGKADSPVIIFIDGLNQLDETMDAHDLTWLPADLPDKVKIIASTLEGEAKDALKTMTDLEVTVTALDDEERKEIIRKIPSAFCKNLDEDHIHELLKREETRNPLYLKVALDELRVFGSFEKLGEKIASMPGNVVDLFQSILVRLEKEHWYELVEQLFCLLECSRYGLTIQELRELMAEMDENSDHVVILRQMRDYMLNRGELIDFFHRSFSKAIRQRYL